MFPIALSSINNLARATGILRPRSSHIQKSWAMQQQQQLSTDKDPTNANSNNNNKIKQVSVSFVYPDGRKVSVMGKVGDTLLDVVVNNNVDIDGFGACEGTLSCSTCHLIFNQSDLDKIGTGPTDEELDMLDLAYGLTDTSRLGCQIYLTKDIDPLEVKVPATINDARL